MGLRKLLMRKSGGTSTLLRIIYGLVGLSGLYFAWMLWYNPLLSLKTMSFIDVAASVLLAIGGINWGVIALSGNYRNDLFGWLK